MSNIFEFEEIEKILNTQFSDKQLLREAFTHSSKANETSKKSNENLEFLGDSILNFVIAEYLYNKFKEHNEGKLSIMRSNIVSANPLCQTVKDMGIDKYVLFGDSAKNVVARSDNMYADLFEAIVGALYIDKGMSAAKNFILNSLRKYLDLKPQCEKIVDYKTRLQEYCQKAKKTVPEYKELSRSGPEHNPIFVCGVYVNNEKVGEGKGRSKQIAEKNAAEIAYNNIKQK